MYEPVGQAVWIAARAAGAEAMVLEPSLAQRNAARRTGTLAVSSADPVKALAKIIEWTGGGPPDVAIDTADVHAEFRDALAPVARRGRLFVVGPSERRPSYPEGFPAPREIDALGVSCCTHEEFA